LVPQVPSKPNDLGATNSIASAVIYGAGTWTSWMFTGSVISGAKNGSVSYAAGLDTMEDKAQEQVLSLLTMSPPPRPACWCYLHIIR